MASIKYSIDKFNGNNFHIWKSNMTDVLTSKDLAHTLEALPVNADQRHTNKYNQDTKKALADIRLHVEATHIQPILKCTTAKEAMDILKKEYKSPSFLRWIALFQQLLSMRLEEGGDLRAHLHRFDSLLTQVANCGEEMPPRYSTAALVITLPPSYQPIVSMFTTVNGEEIVLDTLKNALLLEEQKRAAMSTDTPSDSALYSKKITTCTFCNIRGHTEDICFKKHGKPTSYNNEQKSRTYYNARTRNHRSRPHYRDSRSRSRDRSDHSRDRSDRSRDHSSNRDQHHTAMLAETIKVSNEIPSQTHPNFNTIFKIDHALLAANTVDPRDWVVDSGASTHMTGKREFFSTFLPISNTGVEIANKTIIPAVGKGEIKVILGQFETATLSNVLYVPDLSKNLFSASAATKNDNIEIRLQKSKCIISNKGKTIIEGTKHGSLYTLQMIADTPQANLATTTQLWHERLGHISQHKVNTMALDKLVNGMEGTKQSTPAPCKICLQGKAKRAAITHHQSFPRSLTLLEKIHADLCGPFSTPTIGGAKFFATLTDDYSKKR